MKELKKGRNKKRKERRAVRWKEGKKKGKIEGDGGMKERRKDPKEVKKIWKNEETKGRKENTEEINEGRKEAKNEIGRKDGMNGKTERKKGLSIEQKIASRINCGSRRLINSYVPHKVRIAKMNVLPLGVGSNYRVLPRAMDQITSWATAGRNAAR